MQRTPTKTSESSSKKYEDHQANTQQNANSTTQLKNSSLVSPKLSTTYSVPTLVSPLKGASSSFYSHKKAVQTSFHSQNPSDDSSNDTASKISLEDVKTSPRHPNLPSGKKADNKNLNIHSKLKSISESSNDHPQSLKFLGSGQHNNEITKTPLLTSSEKDRTAELRDERDRESEKDSISQSKASLEARVPIKKISMVTAAESKESRSERTSPKNKTKSENFQATNMNKSIPVLASKESREIITPTKLSHKQEKSDKEDKGRLETTSLVLEPTTKVRKAMSSAFNTVNVNLNPPLSHRTNRKDNASPGIANRSASGNRDRKKLMGVGVPLSKNTSVSESPPTFARTLQNKNSYFRQGTSNSVESRNIKVVARFRPYNKVESELFTNGLGSECMVFPEEKSVIILPENSHWTFDYVFRPDSLQENVYNFLGKETVADVLAGYNGTIFAYGQTSSGKTFTMFGDIYDDEMKGIIPRVSDQIFTYIQDEEDEVEFVVNCSMVEIYKETLYDLLNDRSNELKIKENPRKGIYIDGLNEISICSPEEMMEVLEIGERSRTIAATRMNQHSSRSHTLFIMEIIQRFPNRSEKRGRLNLIDLAGSEKVGKSGAAGETLEEAKKINLSLSCLGNVIHSLTTNCDHIPYRDSKLTRILQESLGGNYKTSLIVTCSPHSSNREETISTLKFATRAKTIKTHYKMNIENSPEALHNVIERLRLELSDAQNQIQRFRTGELYLGDEGTDIGQDLKRFSSFKPPDFSWKGKSPKAADNTAVDKVKKNLLGFGAVAGIGDKRDSTGEKFSSFRALLSEENGSPIKGSENSNLPTEPCRISYLTSNDWLVEKDAVVQKYYNNYTYFKSNLELINQNQLYAKKIEKLNETVETFKFMLNEKEQIIKNQEDQILSQKNELLQNEKKINFLMEQQDRAIIKASKHSNDQMYLGDRVQIMEKQIEGLSEALLNCEQLIENLLKDKNKLINQKFDDMLKQDPEFKAIRLSDYFASSFNFHYEPYHMHFNDSESKNESYSVLDEKNSQAGPDETRGHIVDSFINQFDFQNAFNNASKLSTPIALPLSPVNVLANSQYGVSVQNSTDRNISPQLVIYLLQQQVLQGSVINKQLERIVSALEWKQIIEYGKAKISSKLCQMQENYIRNIETILEKAAISHERLRDRVEAIEVQAIKLRESMVNQNENLRRMSMLGGSKAKLLRKVNREFTKRHLKKPMEETQTPQGREEYEAEGTSNKDVSRKRSIIHAGYKGESMSSIHENYPLTHDKDSSFSHKIPDSLEEAKAMIIAKNQSIEKLKKLIANNNINLSSANQSGEVGGNTSPYEVDYLRSENERLQDKFLILQTEYDLEKTKSEQLGEAYFETKRQNESFRHLNEEIEIASRRAFKAENESWQKIIEEFRVTNESEILRKQEETNRLHDILAKWIFKFMEMQEQKGNAPTHQENILYETYKRKEIPQTSLLYRALESSRLNLGNSPNDTERIISPRFSKKPTDYTPKKY